MSTPISSNVILVEECSMSEADNQEGALLPVDYKEFGRWIVVLAKRTTIYYHKHGPLSMSGCNDWICSRCGEEAPGFVKWFISTRKLRESK